MRSTIYEDPPSPSWDTRPSKAQHYRNTFHLKGQCHEIFDSGFFHESVSPKPLSRPFQILSKIREDIRSSRCTTNVVDTGGKWKKSSIIKVLIICLDTFWEVELAYRYIFAFKFTLRSQQPDIVPIICRRYRWHRWQICHRYQQH